MSTSTCEVCYSEPVAGKWRGHAVCDECLRGGEYYDGLTAEERRRDDEAQARYVEMTSEDAA